MKKYILDYEIYSKESIRIAKNTFDKSDLIKVEYMDNHAQISFDEENTEIFRKMMNEVLCQQCRIDTSRKNSKVAELITTLAMVSAIGKGGSK